jgi:3-hydroxyacyl-CoA dehydrogenase/enoyl-CoA hydratase/3-hydroxybutyryl-CoA epimerase
MAFGDREIEGEPNREAGPMDTPGHGPSWRLEHGGGGWTFWFDRPGTSQNSLDSSSLHELAEGIGRVKTDDRATRLLIRSAKAKGFCAGADLKELRQFPAIDRVESFARFGGEVLERLACLRPTTVAILHGACLGGGLELALACDVRIVLSSAAIGLPEVRLGLIPGWGGTWRLPRLIGMEGALDLLLSGRTNDGPEARTLGLVDAVAEPENLEEAVSRLVDAPIHRDRRPLTGDWRERLSIARNAIEDDELRPARERLIEVIATELDGQTLSAPRALAELAFEPKGRASLDSFASKHSVN